MLPIPRMIDANANRAREAMRVMEDAARFALNDAGLSADLKSLRHDFRSAMDQLPGGWVEANRDTPGDVGTAITTPDESTRSGLADIVIAAGKRLTEALRTIEECGKLLPPSGTQVARPDGPTFSSRIEALRYRAYELDQRLQLRMGSGRAQQWRVCVLLTESLCKLPWKDVLRASIDGGADCVQVREKDLNDRDLARRVEQVNAIVKPGGGSVIVNDRADIALACGADSVHLGRDDLSIHAVRRIAGRMLLIGASTHNLDEARKAVGAGADYCGVGPMFSSSLKPDRSPAGPAYLRAFLNQYPRVPHLAIGGITPRNVAELVAVGCRGVAVSTAVCGADDPAMVVQALRNALEENNEKRMTAADVSV